MRSQIRTFNSRFISTSAMMAYDQAHDGIHESADAGPKAVPRSSLLEVTLLKMMAATAAVAVLAAIAYPTYQLHERQSRRESMQAFLVEAGFQQMQRAAAAHADVSSPAAPAMTLPAQLDGFYTVIMTDDARSPGFKLTAMPVGPQVKDICGELAIDQAGRKTPANCW